MPLAAINQWISIFALLLSIGNGLWVWFSRPARDLSTKLDEHREDTEGQLGQANARIEVAMEGLKGHDRRIQRVEDDVRHLPTKDDLRHLEMKVVGIKTELDIVARVVTRIDEFLRNKP